MGNLRIASNNVFWLQGHPFLEEMPGSPEPDIRAELLALWKEMDAGLLCLQEVQSREVFEGISSALAMPGEWCAGAELTQYGTAAIWKEGRILADWRAESERPQRAWQLVALPGGDGRELAVANCHLPSNRQLSDEAAARQRIRELTVIIDRRPRPDVILGDFNEQPGGALGEFLSERGYVDAAVHTGNGRLGTTYKGRRGDQIWIASQVAEEVCGYGVAAHERMQTSAAGKEFLSDHFPVWVDLKA